MKPPRIFRRETTANPRAAACLWCPAWFYGLTRKAARQKLERHVRHWRDWRWV